MEMQQDVVKLQREVGFLELLKNNPIFRRLWIGLAISLLGEWFSTVALFVLICLFVLNTEILVPFLNQLAVIVIIFYFYVAIEYLYNLIYKSG